MYATLVPARVTGRRPARNHKNPNHEGSLLHHFNKYHFNKYHFNKYQFD